MAQDKLQFDAREGIQVYLASNPMQANVSSDLGMMFQSNQQVGAMASKDKLNVNGLAVIYDKPGLQFLVGDKAGLQNLVGSQEKLNSILLGTGNLQGTQVLAVFGAEKLRIIKISAFFSGCLYVSVLIFFRISCLKSMSTGFAGSLSICPFINSHSLTT